MALKAPTGGQFENPEPGSYLARCYGFIDLGTQLHKSTHQGKDDWLQRDVRFLFELPMNKMEGIYNLDSKGKPFVTSTTLKFSLAPTAKMRKMIKGWRGKDLTKEEADAFVVRKMIGAPCRISLVEAGDFINIDSFSRVSKEEVATMPPMVSPAIYFSLDPEEFDRNVFNGLSEKTKDKIFLSPEYQALVGGKPQTEPDDSPFAPSNTPTAGGTPLTDDEAANLVSRDRKSEAADDQVPF